MKAIIEIPKGDDRRRHVKDDKSGFVDLGPIRGLIPVNDGIMPIHYGYIPETLSEKERDEIDILVLSDTETKTGEEIEVEPIALILREDGDDKVVATDKSRNSIGKWSDISDDERGLIEAFFSYHHKFVSIGGREEAIRYIEAGRKRYQWSQE
jgi:inorganic pyrophosphatase